MPVTIHINKSAVAARVSGAFQKGLPLLTASIRDDCNEYCKRDTGTLIASSMLHSRLDQGLVIWQTPYARRQYWEIRTAYQTRNPKSTWRWCEYAKNANIGKWQTQAQKVLEMNL